MPKGVREREGAFILCVAPLMTGHCAAQAAAHRRIATVRQ
jgi:hypothetical protein